MFAFILALMVGEYMENCLSKAIGILVVLAAIAWLVVSGTGWNLILGASAIMEGFLVFGSLGFWVFITAIIVGTMALTENSRVVLAAFVLVAGGFCLQKYSGLTIVPYILANPWIIVFIVLGYLAAGTIWAVLKWYLFLKKTRRKYDDILVEANEKYKDQPPTPVEGSVDYDEKVREFNYFLQGQQQFIQGRFREELGYDYGEQIRPQVRAFKARIVGWIAYWPTSVLWTVISDAVHWVRTIAIDIYRHIAKALQRMADNVWKGTDTKNEELGKPITRIRDLPGRIRGGRDGQ